MSNPTPPSWEPVAGSGPAAEGWPLSCPACRAPLGTLRFDGVALADGRYKDNRIPPRGFRIGEASARLIEPVYGGAADPAVYDALDLNI